MQGVAFQPIITRQASLLAIQYVPQFADPNGALQVKLVQSAEHGSNKFDIVAIDIIDGKRVWKVDGRYSRTYKLEPDQPNSFFVETLIIGGVTLTCEDESAPPPYCFCVPSDWAPPKELAVAPLAHLHPSLNALAPKGPKEPKRRHIHPGGPRSLIIPVHLKINGQYHQCNTSICVQNCHQQKRGSSFQLATCTPTTDRALSLDVFKSMWKFWHYSPDGRNDVFFSYAEKGRTSSSDSLRYTICFACCAHDFGRFQVAEDEFTQLLGQLRCSKCAWRNFQEPHDLKRYWWWVVQVHRLRIQIALCLVTGHTANMAAVLSSSLDLFEEHRQFMSFYHVCWGFQDLYLCLMVLPKYQHPALYRRLEQLESLLVLKKVRDQLAGVPFPDWKPRPGEREGLGRNQLGRDDRLDPCLLLGRRGDTACLERAKLRIGTNISRRNHLVFQAAIASQLPYNEERMRLHEEGVHVAIKYGFAQALTIHYALLRHWCYHVPDITMFSDRLRILGQNIADFLSADALLSDAIYGNNADTWWQRGVEDVVHIGDGAMCDVI